MAHSPNLSQFLYQSQQTNNNGDLNALLEGIASACRVISNAVNHGGLKGVLGSASSENVQGETQKKLDILSNDIFLETLEWRGQLAAMGSEEMDDIYPIADHFIKGPYLILFDPLDGSSNIDVNITVGSIFSVLKCPPGVTHPTMDDFFQPGSQQVCAGFSAYGPSTMLVLTTGNGVNGFTLCPELGEFVLTNPNMTIPKQTGEIAINASNQRFWEAPVQRYVNECFAGKEGPRGRNFNMRWVGSMVADVHRILIRGGVFMYPKDTKDPSKEGRLRLMYEANPMSFIVEQAGGASSTGYQRIMEVQPNDLHQRVPVIMGSAEEVETIVQYHR